MPFSLSPQTFSDIRTEDGRRVRMLTNDNPYLRLSVDGASVQLQGGCVYGTGGDLLTKDKWPGWLDSEIAKCSDEALIACGWLEPKAAAPVDPVAAAREALSRLTADERMALLDAAAPEPPVVETLLPDPVGEPAATDDEESLAEVDPLA